MLTSCSISISRNVLAPFSLHHSLNKFVTNVFFQEHLDYELVQSTNPEFNKAVVRVNVFREHRQTIQVGIIIERGSAVYGGLF